MNGTKILVILLVTLLVFSFGCTGTKTDGSDDTTNAGGVVISESDTSDVDDIIDDLDSDMSEIDDLIADSEIDIEGSGIDESLI